MTGDQWAAAHGDAWQNFLHTKLKKCECVHPATSNSNRAKVLKEEESLAQGEPAKCLVCFAPINMEVRRFPPPLPQPAPAGNGVFRYPNGLFVRLCVARPTAPDFEQRPNLLSPGYVSDDASE